jgi:hypothetical protein
MRLFHFHYLIAGLKAVALFEKFPQLTVSYKPLGLTRYLLKQNLQDKEPTRFNEVFFLIIVFSKTTENFCTVYFIRNYTMRIIVLKINSLISITIIICFLLE